MNTLKNNNRTERAQALSYELCGRTIPGTEPDHGRWCLVPYLNPDAEDPRTALQTLPTRISAAIRVRIAEYNESGM